MNKKWLLGLGGIAAISLPVSTVIACGNKTPKNETTLKETVSPPTGQTKNAKVTIIKLDIVNEAIKGKNNAYTLAVGSSDTAELENLQEALKAMVTKADNDTTTVEFVGSWVKDFSPEKNGTYIYTVKAPNYHDVKFTVTVTGNTAEQSGDGSSTNTPKTSTPKANTPKTSTPKTTSDTSLKVTKGKITPKPKGKIQDKDVIKGTTTKTTLKEPVSPPTGQIKNAKVTITKLDIFHEAIQGKNNTYTLAVGSSDTAELENLQEALKDMVTKADNDTTTVKFTGSWDTDFNPGTNGTYIYTIKAPNYHDVKFTITVTGNKKEETQKNNWFFNKF